MVRYKSAQELIDNISPGNQELNRKRLTGKKIDISSAAVPHLKAHEKHAEKELQALCENYLTQRGYWRLTAANTVHCFEQDVVCKGFFGHLVAAKRNPLLPDLFVFPFPSIKPTLLIELKTCNVYQPGQLAFIGAGMWTEVRDFESFKYCLDKWEG